MIIQCSLTFSYYSYSSPKGFIHLISLWFANLDHVLRVSLSMWEPLQPLIPSYFIRPHFVDLYISTCNTFSSIQGFGNKGKCFNSIVFFVGFKKSGNGFISDIFFTFLGFTSMLHTKVLALGFVHSVLRGVQFSMASSLDISLNDLIKEFNSINDSKKKRW